MRYNHIQKLVLNVVIHSKEYFPELVEIEKKEAYFDRS